ncbi:uncharacterized protein LOC129918674 [Episyrphus balteatus]|uniref:uncharacterized protein LOC129918674 n=1 Tax=Episyrphus balteatus TaxID=286459 RepID=UPI00248619BB|nr:uncharacterized protein LOC129918674 [Episyrphus balteatus]
MNNSNYVVVIAWLVVVGLAGLATPAKGQDANLVDDICLGCICEAASGCDLSKTCDLEHCGLFRMDYLYWADGGMRTSNGEFAHSPTAYENCAYDPSCATESVQNYIQTFLNDCNQDGKIDCYDYASIHKLGRYGCPGIISGTYARTLKLCLDAYGVYSTENYTSIQNSTETPQTTEMALIQEIVEEVEDFVDNFNSGTTEVIKQNTENILVANKLRVSTNLPPQSPLKYLYPQKNMTNTSSIESKLDQIYGGQRSVSQETNDFELISQKVDIPSRFGDDSIVPIPSAPDGLVDNQLRRRALEDTDPDSEDRVFNMLDKIEKSRKVLREKELRFQETFLQEFIKQNRIDEERNEILKEMATVKKPSPKKPNYFLS